MNALVALLLAAALQEPAPAGDEPRAAVRYYSHSGVSVETEKHILVFDYIGPHANDGQREVGLLDPSQLGEKEVVVFVSHAHHDHFDPVVIEWAAKRKLRLVVSDDVEKQADDLPEENVLVVEPRETHEQGGLVIRTARSMDAGVAFWVEVDGLTIYHSGDHALWGWQESSFDTVHEAWLADLEIFLELDEQPDIAFVCADLRLPGKAKLTGALEFVEEFRPRQIYAIHNYAKHAEASGLLRAQLEERGLEVDAPLIEEHGQVFSYPPR